ncbi:adhesion G-protein coupled receptor G6-like isoform X1 [Halichondria panicea]|uniref:adhesion G-protein coupled receptor G6-like isoform X1 n=1 Tax=Halichondria panicea TaxID=6063 RepID=UPI00312B4F0C
MDENAMGVWSGQKPLCVAGCVAGIHQDHSWPNTALGSIALSPCPCAELGVFAGNVSRQCSGSISEGGMWKDELDLSSCETTLSDISRELCQIALALSSNKTTQASNQIANITSKPQNLTTNQIAMVTSIVEQLTGEATVNQEVRDNYLQTINNIQLANAEAIYQSQLAMNSSTRILASLDSFLDNLNISTVSRNSTSNRTVFSFETFAITVQDVYPGSFQGQAFVVDLGPVEEAIKNTGVIDQDALKCNGGKGNTADKNSTASLHLSSSILEDHPATNRTSLTQRLSYSVFLSGVLFLPENRSTDQVGSIVVAARLACLQTNKTVPVRTNFLIRTKDNINSSSCAVFNTQDRFGAWDTAGCIEITSSNGRKDCECRQLGHFGILFDLNPTSLPENLAIVLSTITYVGLGLSVVCLLVFMFTIFISKKLLADKQNQILINISISLICLYLTFLIGGFTVGVPPLCGLMSALLQYFFLVFFSWMAVEAVWLYIKLVVVMGSDSLTSKFMLKAGLPAWYKHSLQCVFIIFY